jgi:hypothetical protein
MFVTHVRCFDLEQVVSVGVIQQAWGPRGHWRPIV